MFEVKQKTYRLKGLTRILGSQPADPEVRTNYIAHKAADQKRGEEENSKLPIDMDKQNLTVFLRDNGGKKEEGFGLSFTLGETGTALPINLQ